MAPDYLLFTFGNDSGRSYVFAKKAEGNPDPYAGALAGGHKSLAGLVNALVYGLNVKFDPENVETINETMPGLTDGMYLEPVDNLSLELFRRLYRIEKELAPIKRQIMAKAVGYN